MSIRDALVAHAFHAKSIPLGGASSEYINSYYNTVWAGCNFSRYPMFQPKPSVQSVAVFTQVFDCAEFSRLIPTGSQTVYAMEFKRGNEFVYAIWTTRGQTDVAIPGTEKLDVVFHYGKNGILTPKNGSSTVRISEEPIYIIAKKALQSVNAELTRSYPYEVYPGQQTPVVVNNMDNAQQWVLDTKADKRLDAPESQPIIAGMFDVRETRDEKMGKCIEVELSGERDYPALVSEAAFLRLKAPETIPGTPDTLGVWVRGNSSWGKIYFEIEDADGKIWLTSHTGGYGCEVYDWPGKMTLNFDGWHFLQFPLTAKSSVEVHSPGDNEWQWQCNDFGNKEIVYPVKLRAVGFSMGRKTLVINHMEDLAQKSIRFSKFSAITTGKSAEKD